MHSLIVVPARGGSKGIPKKNIYPVNGKPLLEYTLDVFEKANIDGRLVVSTDSDEIAEVARKYKSAIVLSRPEDISTDNASTESALIHALRCMEETYGDKFDTVITAQPTSPFRKAETIKRFVKQFFERYEDIDSQITLTETRSDFWVKDEKKNYMRLFPNAPRRRQERAPLYIENSMLYITKTQVLRQTNSVLGMRVGGFVIDDVEGLDINEMRDIELAEFYLRNGRY